MTCTGEWIRKGNKKITMTIKAATPKPALVEMGREVINRDTEKSTNKSYSETDLAAGVNWDLKPRRIYKMSLVVSPQGSKVKVSIEIGDHTVASGTCTRGSLPVVGDWKITTF